MDKKSENIDTQDGGFFQYSDPVRILSAMERIDNAIQITSDVEVVLDNIVNEVIHIFQSDRAWLFYPCNPNLSSFEVAFESTTPSYPGAKALKGIVAMTGDMADYCNQALSKIGKPVLDPPGGRTITNDIAIRFNVKSLIFMALQPQIGDAWMFGLHQCDHNRMWTDDDKKLFKIIGQRVTSCIGNMLYLKRLKESEKRYRSVVETVKEGVILQSASGKIQTWNKGAEDIFGILSNDAVGQTSSGNDWPTIHEDGSTWEGKDHPSMITLQTGKPCRNEIMGVHHSSGKLRWVSINTNPLFSSNSDKPYAVAISFSDITERKQWEKTLWESTERFQKVFNSQLDAIFVLNAEIPARIVEYNAASLKIFGYEPNELIGETTEKLHVDAPHLKKFQNELYPSIKRNGHLANFEFSMKRKNGTVFPTEHSILELKNDAGERTGWVSIVRDLTERKQTETLLRQTHKMEAIGNLAGGIAHEFNNALGIILGNAELALDDVPDWNPAKESLREIRTASFRAKEVVRQILSFARKSMTALKPVEINSIAKESLKLIRASIPAMVNIRSSIPSEPKMILGDTTELHQIIINLCTNAAYAMKTSGGILEAGISEVRLDKKNVMHYEDLSPGDYIRLAVTDNGEGIEPPILEKVFEPYFTTKEFGAGSGMGLAVVYGIVKKCKGAIHIESTVGEGTTVEILFPRIEEKIPFKKKMANELQTGSEKILLVDDDPSIVNMIRQMLERLGYTVSGMTDSAAALERFQSAPDDFDLVITDMAMPNMSGDQLAIELIKVGKDIPILLCTGHSDTIDEKKAKEIGIKGFAMKPLDKGKLARAVRAVLDKKHDA